MATVKPLLDALRAALAAVPVPPQPLELPAPDPVPQEAARCLSVGPWGPPGSQGAAWGPLMAPCGHPGEADALVVLNGAPVALLQRRWHLVPTGDPDAAQLAPVGLYELHSPGGRTVLAALASGPLLADLAERTAAAPPTICPV